MLCGVLALAAIMVIHLGFTFERHLETGWLKGVYPRYYFPLGRGRAMAPAPRRGRLQFVAARGADRWSCRAGFAGYTGLDVASRTLF